MGQYIDRYAYYLDKLREEIAADPKGRPLVGFCSNADMVLTWDAESYNKLLKKYLHTQPDQGRNEPITSMEDFARISSWYIMQGIGGNTDILNQLVFLCQVAEIAVNDPLF